MEHVHRILERNSGESIEVRPGESLLAAMERQGKRCVPVGCRGGGCGVCLVRIHAGRFDFGAMSARFVDADERRQGLALACRLYPLEDGEVEFSAALVRQRFAASRFQARNNPNKNEQVSI